MASSVTSSGEEVGAATEEASDKKPLQPIVIPIDMNDAQLMEERARSCEPLNTAMALLQRSLYETLDYDILIGHDWTDPMAEVLPRTGADSDDEAEEGEALAEEIEGSRTLMYTNTDAFKRAWARFDYERRLLEQVFPIAIMRKRKNMVRYAMDVLAYRSSKGLATGLQVRPPRPGLWVSVFVSHRPRRMMG